MWKDKPDLIARASSLYAERIRTGAVKCTCGALADHTARYHGHAPGCEIETGWPDTLDALRDADFNADLETAAAAIGQVDAVRAAGLARVAALETLDGRLVTITAELEAKTDAAIAAAEAGIPALEELEARNAAELERIERELHLRRLTHES